eukprot:4564653-Pleurochrysis_carterae.AAC.2
MRGPGSVERQANDMATNGAASQGVLMVRGKSGKPCRIKVCKQLRDGPEEKAKEGFQAATERISARGRVRRESPLRSARRASVATKETKEKRESGILDLHAQTDQQSEHSI